MGSVRAQRRRPHRVVPLHVFMPAGPLPLPSSGWRAAALALARSLSISALLSLHRCSSRAHPPWTPAPACSSRPSCRVLLLLAYHALPRASPRAPPPPPGAAAAPHAASATSRSAAAHGPWAHAAGPPGPDSGLGDATHWGDGQPSHPPRHHLATGDPSPYWIDPPYLSMRSRLDRPSLPGT
jgi:hypothetical protein